MTNYKITRHDGTIQYAKKYEHSDEYFLNGFGFGIKEFDALSVEEIDSIPTALVEGFVYYDEDGSDMKAICDINKKWNGWAMPYIHHSSIEKFIKLTSWEGNVFTLLPNGDLLSVVPEDDYEETIKPEIINGEKYYYLGNEGLCFEFTNAFDYEESLHQEARDLMDAINLIHKWDSLLSLDEYLMTHFDDLTNAEMSDIQTLLDKFNNL
jgi:hypothetical protein